MKILVYQSITTGNNLGDTGMIEGVVRRLLHITSDVQLCVHYISFLPKEIWECKPVVKASMNYFSESNFLLSCINKMPYLRKYEKQFQCTMLGRGINVREIRVGNTPDSPTLDAWCAEYDAMHLVGMGGLTEHCLDDIWHFCCLTYAFALQNKPIILTGQQLGPFYSKSIINPFKQALLKTKFIGLREPTDSLVFCQNMNLDDERYAVMGDDSLGLPAVNLKEVESYLSRYGILPGKFLAVNVRIASYAGSNAKYIRKIADILSFISRLYELPILVVPIALDEYDSDINSGYLLSKTVGSDRIKILDKAEELNAALVKGILGQAFAGVGVSYHFCTFALSQGVPAICIFDGAYYSQKARGIASFWGNARLALPLGKLNTEDATKQIIEVIEDQQFRNALDKRAKTAIKQWEEVFDKQVYKMLGDTKQAGILK